MLYPQQNHFRFVFDLGGFWSLRPDPHDLVETERWYERALEGDVMTVAVPGSWNEQLAERGLMNFVGTCVYETGFDIPQGVIDGNRVWLYVAAADHTATVWVNGSAVGSHAGGYMPFELEITDYLKTDGGSNRLTIAVDSRLTTETIPQDVDPTRPPYNDPSYDRRHLFPPTRFDFFPYGGLTRSVMVVTTPRKRISAISIDSRLDGSVFVNVDADGDAGARVTILDSSANEVARSGLSSTGPESDGVALEIEPVEAWSPAHPHLYTAVVELLDSDGDAVDRYEETFGIREIEIEDGQIFLNGEPLFLTGFGKHEDLPIVGRGRFDAASVKDFELMRWMGANSFRTSHYPYDEETIRLADQLGFLVIDEVPAVSLGFLSDNFDDLDPLLANHKQAITELIARDRNHPSVVAWSIVNEANLWAEEDYQNEAGRRYFKSVYDHAKSLDESRPVISIIMSVHSAADVSLEACDIVGLNRYFGWYTEPVDLDFAAQRIEEELERIFARHGKPIIMTEFGADTIEGYHATNAQFFTEEFQVAMLMTYAAVLESKYYCAGMHVWNFADFRTPQHFRRVVLNRKGVLNRSRDPKAAAFVLRDYWNHLGRVHDDHRPASNCDDFLVPDLKRPVRWRYEGDGGTQSTDSDARSMDSEARP